MLTSFNLSSTVLVILESVISSKINASYLDIMSMVSGAIRPAGESYREQLFRGEWEYGKMQIILNKYQLY